ncbi:unnamed protein product [Urochloa decumbens]|uniref:Disease resistance R13L4/SHOC-2-like LRR domain-containing protein n=1 Tax=Urochloa decumbens TaxID=240449 RepID=A0ABC9B2S1_9POAL
MRGYVYKMRSLCSEDSQTLAYLKDIAHDSCPCHQGQCQCPLETLQKKCDGLPLALVSSANHLKSLHQGGPTIGDCTTLCKKLGSLLHGNPDNVAATAGAQLKPFADLREVLVDNYISLADGTLGACCLLYLSISQDARCLKKNKITGRWVAEGYAPSQQEQAKEIFQNLINMNIIQPVGICTSRTCKLLGIVHEFVLHKTMVENFVMTIDMEEQSRASTGEKKRKSRHLFVRGGNVTSSRATVGMDLSHVRSLTVVAATNKSNNVGSGCAGQGNVEGNNVSVSVGQGNGEDHASGRACDGFFKFRKYKVLRVLDLEECTEVNNSHVANICDLWNLRYLRLGPNVNKLPNKIKKLKLLERLQLSKTKVTELPVEIIGMPSLKHLIGRFVLLGPEPSDKMVENSKLETLSGIVVDPRQGFLPLVPRLKNLMKVNMCFDQSSRNIFGLTGLLLDAIKGYLQRRLESPFARSLSIDFVSLYGTSYESYPQSAMKQLHRMLSSNKYYLTSLKLHDRLLSPWPQFVALLSGLTKLCLSLNSLTNDLLSAISALQHALVHLKLMANEIPEDLVIQDGKFQSLQTLCFVVSGPNCSIPQIQIHGVLPELRYFQLISKLLAPNLCSIQIRNLTRLQEIELHAEVSLETRQEWETAAMDHPNRPDVLPLRSVNDPTGGDDGATMACDEATAIAVAGAAQVNHTPAAIAIDRTASESCLLEGNGRAENLTSVASPAGEEGRAVPVVTTTGNTLEQEPVANPVAGGAEEPEESPIITATATSHEPTQIPFACRSTPANYESSYPADTIITSAPPEDAVASPEHVADNHHLGLTTLQNMAFANNHVPSVERDKPNAVEQEASDTSIPAQLVGEAQVNNASNGVPAVSAKGHGHNR